MYHLPKVPQVPEPINGGEGIYKITSITMHHVTFVRTIAHISLLINAIIILFDWFFIDPQLLLRVCVTGKFEIKNVITLSIIFVGINSSKLEIFSSLCTSILYLAASYDSHTSINEFEIWTMGGTRHIVTIRSIPTIVVWLCATNALLYAINCVAYCQILRHKRQKTIQKQPIHLKIIRIVE
jgi:hypothetical protein